MDYEYDSEAEWEEEEPGEDLVSDDDEVDSVQPDENEDEDVIVICCSVLTCLFRMAGWSRMAIYLMKSEALMIVMKPKVIN